MSDHWWEMAAGGAGTLAGLALAEKGYSDLGKIGERAFSGFAGAGGLAKLGVSLAGRRDRINEQAAAKAEMRKMKKVNNLIEKSKKKVYSYLIHK